MTDEEMEIWDQRVTDACTHYKETNEIQDILLPGFDQMGRWSSTILIRDRSKAHIAKLMALQKNLWVNSGSGRSPRV